MREKMLAGDICNRIVVFAERGMSVLQAAQLMRSRHVGCLVVVDETGAGREVVGLVTLDDLLSLISQQLREMASVMVTESLHEHRERA